MYEVSVSSLYKLTLDRMHFDCRWTRQRLTLLDHESHKNDDNDDVNDIPCGL